MGTYRNNDRDSWRNDQSWRPADNDRDRMDRDRDRGERGERGDDRGWMERGVDWIQRSFGDDDRYSGRGDEGGRFGYGGASRGGQNDDDRQRRSRGQDDYADRGRQGYGYGGRDDQQNRYGGMGGQSGANSGGMGQSYNTQGFSRENTGYGGRGYGGPSGQQGRTGQGNPYETTGYGYGGGYGGQDLVGGHRGKGPQGYQRSDERVREEVCQALSDDDHIDASNIEITVKGGEVTLSGHVNDRRTKRLAEDCIEHIPGVKDVHNQIRVQHESSMTAGGNGRTDASQNKSQSVTSSTDKDVDTSKRPRA